MVFSADLVFEEFFCSVSIWTALDFRCKTISQISKYEDFFPDYLICGFYSNETSDCDRITVGFEKLNPDIFGIGLDSQAS